MNVLSRRQLLRGDLKAGPAALRPPWALAEERFLAACTRCDACIGTCPEHVLVRGSGGFPQFVFHDGGCTFCGECARACGSGAIVRGEAPAWSLAAEIGGACLAAAGVVCRSCGEACEAGAIRFRLSAGRVPQPELDRAACTGCGFCVGVCPAGAISMIDEPAAMAAAVEA